MVPALVSSGEEIVHGGQSWMVPGPRVAADNVMAMLPVGASVFTEHGQALRSAGMPDSRVLAEQMPHFATGGKVQPWRRVGATVYDDPPPGAFGSLANGFRSSFGTARRTDGGGTGFGWLARAFGMRGELPANFAVDFAHNGKIVTLAKRDRGYGQGGDGVTSDPQRRSTSRRDSWARLGVNSSWKGSVLARPHDGRPHHSMARPPATSTATSEGRRSPIRARSTCSSRTGRPTRSSRASTLAAEGTSRLFRSWRGLDADLFSSATSGGCANERDLPKKVMVDVKGTRGKRTSTKLARGRSRERRDRLARCSAPTACRLRSVPRCLAADGPLPRPSGDVYYWRYPREPELSLRRPGRRYRRLGDERRRGVGAWQHRRLSRRGHPQPEPLGQVRQGRGAFVLGCEHVGWACGPHPSGGNVAAPRREGRALQERWRCRRGRRHPDGPGPWPHPHDRHLHADVESVERHRPDRQTGRRRDRRGRQHARPGRPARSSAQPDVQQPGEIAPARSTARSGS